MKIISLLILFSWSFTSFADELPDEHAILIHSDNKQWAVDQAKEKTMKLLLDSASEPVLNKPNLDRIKKFIIQQRETCTFCNMYNHNPCFQNQDFSAYLIPDPGPNGQPQWNINCDTTKGDFNQLVIRTNDFKYIDIDFRRHDKVEIFGGSITEAKLKESMEDVVREMLKVMDSVDQ